MFPQQYRNLSIRLRLLITLLLIIVVVNVVSIGASYQAALHEVQELFDAHLAQSARVLHALLAPDLADGHYDGAGKVIAGPGSAVAAELNDGESSALGHQYERKIAFQVWDLRQRLLLRSASAPSHPLSEVGLSPAHRGYVDETFDDGTWRVFTLWDKNERYLIQVGERYDVRLELTEDISSVLITPEIVTVLVIGLLLWVGLGRGLLPLRKVTEEVTRRNPQNLDPMDIGPVPYEVRPLVEELNTLFARLQQAFDRERRFTDDAAHEMRTPIAALKTQAQVALRATDDLQRKQALRQVVVSVDRAHHLLEQMLTLARLDPRANPIKPESLFLYELAAEVVSLVAPKALAKAINLELLGDEQAVVYAEPITLSVLIRNLVDNAVSYTPFRGSVTVQIAHHQSKVELVVTDTGPGIDGDVMPRVFDRFYRVLGNTAQGCGLGLAIAKEIADLQHIQLYLENRPEGGLQVRVVF